MQSIPSRLLKGERVPYLVLRYKRPEAREFLEAWWETADMSVLTRPLSLPDNDPILVHTSGKEYADTLSGQATFPKVMRNLLRNGRMTEGHRVPREQFHEEVVQYLAGLCVESEEGPPAVYFTGGGYGAGKTTSVQFLTREGKLHPQISMPALQGVDICKQLIPEFSMVKAVSDGRASEICQEESREISELLFAKLINEKRCFAWDSSMSNRVGTLGKIEAAQSQGYRIGFIGVVTDIEVAKRRAMQRAKATQRFAHPTFLEGSHRMFAEYIDEYWDLCSHGILLENTREISEGGPKIVTSKGAPY